MKNEWNGEELVLTERLVEDERVGKQMPGHRGPWGILDVIVWCLGRIEELLQRKNRSHLHVERMDRGRRAWTRETMQEATAMVGVGDSEA